MDDKKMNIARDKVANYERNIVGEGDAKRRVIDNGDEVAQLMRGLATDDELRVLAARYGLTERFDGWAHLNRGQKRMNLGNSIRHAIRKQKAADAKAQEQRTAA